MAVVLCLVVKSGGVDEDEFRILLGRDDEFGFVDGGDAVADRNPLPVDEDHALGGGEIGVPEPSRRVRDGRSGKKSCAQNPARRLESAAPRRPSGYPLASGSGVPPDRPSGIAAVPTGVPPR